MPGDWPERDLWVSYEREGLGWWRCGQNGHMEEFRSGSLTFPVLDSGPAAGEPVVLLHGFPQAASSWGELIPALTAAGYRVLAPDQRGYAPGALPRGRRAYRMSLLVSDVVGLLDGAGIERAHVVGHDWGAAVGWTLAAEAPDRLLSLTALSVPHPATMAKAAVTGTQGIRSWYMLFFQLPWLPERLLDPSRSGGRKRLVRLLTGSGQDRASAERDADVMAQPGVLTGALNWYRALPFSSAPGRVDIPTLFIWGRLDRFIGSKAASLCGRYVTGSYEFRVIDGTHWIQGEVADLLLGHFGAHRAR